MAQSTGFCGTCNKQSLLNRPDTSHVLHLLLSVFSAGLWLPIWFLSAVKVGGWRCQSCGSKVRGTAGKLVYGVAAAVGLFVVVCVGIGAVAIATGH
ncbi:MAG TPA: hypothetical protein VG713_09020 [Pirellulales bacterium]|nr:hypothetical protein [Pirellulales bacterium]